MNIIGIDPGTVGGIVSINDKELLAYDIPAFEITKGKTVRKRIDIKRLIGLLTIEQPDHAFVEQVSAQFGNGAASAFTFGQACGIIEACLVACCIPYTYVTPQRWKKDLGVPADKDGARMRATQLLPEYAHNWDRKCDHNRAEAALISYWGRQQHQKQKEIK